MARRKAPHNLPGLGEMDLQRALVSNPAATFYMRATADNPQLDIAADDVLIVDFSLKPKANDTVVAHFGGNKLQVGKFSTLADVGNALSVGVVTHAIHMLPQRKREMQALMKRAVEPKRKRKRAPPPPTITEKRETKVDDLRAGDFISIHQHMSKEPRWTGYFKEASETTVYVQEAGGKTYQLPRNPIFTFYLIDSEQSEREAQIEMLKQRAARLTSNDQESEKFQVLKQIYDLEREAKTGADEWPDEIAA